MNLPVNGILLLALLTANPQGCEEEEEGEVQTVLMSFPVDLGSLGNAM